MKAMRQNADTTEAEALDFEELWGDLLHLRGVRDAKITEFEREVLNTIQGKIKQYGDNLRVSDKQRAILNRVHANNYA